MSTIKQKCTLFKPSGVQWFYLNVVLFYFGFLGLRFIHESMHIIVHVLMGGTLGSPVITIMGLGGSHINLLNVIIPVFVWHSTSKIGLVETLAGPLSTIAIATIVAATQNRQALSGPCGGRNKWRKRRGLVFASMLQGLWDAIYLIPMNFHPFRPGNPGDGYDIQRILNNQFPSLQHIHLFGLTINAQIEYLIALGAILLMFYNIYKVLSCTPLMCSCNI